jgi:hypothetical protein
MEWVVNADTAMDNLITKLLLNGFAVYRARTGDAAPQYVTVDGVKTDVAKRSAYDAAMMTTGLAYGFLGGYVIKECLSTHAEGEELQDRLLEIAMNEYVQQNGIYVLGVGVGVPFVADAIEKGNPLKTALQSTGPMRQYLEKAKEKYAEGDGLLARAITGIGNVTVKPAQSLMRRIYNPEKPEDAAVQDVAVELVDDVAKKYPILDIPTKEDKKHFAGLIYREVGQFRQFTALGARLFANYCVSQPLPSTLAAKAMYVEALRNVVQTSAHHKDLYL